MSIETNKAALLRAAENFSDPNKRETYLELYDTDCVMYGVPGVEPGLESIKQFYYPFWAAFPDCALTLGNVIAEGDKIACDYTVSGTHQGAFMGIPPTGKAVSFTGCTIMQFANGKCVERWTQSDFMGLMKQLGVIPG